MPNSEPLGDRVALDSERRSEQWGKLTDDDFDVVAGRRDQLAGKIQERYRVAKDEAERQVAELESKGDESWFTKDKNRMIRA